MVKANSKGGTINVLYLIGLGPCRPMRHDGGEIIKVLCRTLLATKLASRGYGYRFFGTPKRLILFPEQ